MIANKYANCKRLCAMLIFDGFATLVCFCSVCCSVVFLPLTCLCLTIGIGFEESPGRNSQGKYMESLTSMEKFVSCVLSS